MCLAIPCKIIEMGNDTAIVDAGGVETEVSLLLLDEPKVGEYVIVHAGYAIQKMDEREAIESLKILNEIAALAGYSGGG